ncbi:hypothetical protein ACUN0C_10760 [Faunimonas sp. B44]|uniref:hypothetical protein n=1 Tax=Faunimonas sp. B44 TaxID=3461493 RepID=UPI0040445CC0
MRHSHQPDLFAPEAEPDLFGEGYSPPVYRPDPDRVRARLQGMLAEVRAVGPHGLGSRRAGLYQLIFPQMTQCLPDAEAAQLRLEFEAELARSRKLEG